MTNPLASSSCLSRCFSSWRAPYTGEFGQPGGLVAQIEWLAARLTVFISLLSAPRSERHKRWTLGWSVGVSRKTSTGFLAADAACARGRCCRLTSGGEMLQVNIWWPLHARCEQQHPGRGGWQGCSGLSAVSDESACAVGRHHLPPGRGCLSLLPVPVLLEAQRCLNPASGRACWIQLTLGKRLRSPRVSVQLTALRRR